jgi:hypothetical protein
LNRLMITILRVNILIRMQQLGRGQRNFGHVECS